jgi:hypothetical protein
MSPHWPLFFNDVAASGDLSDVLRLRALGNENKPFPFEELVRVPDSAPEGIIPDLTRLSSTNSKYLISRQIMHS